MSKFPAGGNLHGSNASTTPIEEKSYGKKPVVGQSRAYSGGNAHGRHEKLTKPPAPGSKSGHAAASRPTQRSYTDGE